MRVQSVLSRDQKLPARMRVFQENNNKRSQKKIVLLYFVSNKRRLNDTQENNEPTLIRYNRVSTLKLLRNCLKC